MNKIMRIMNMINAAHLYVQMVCKSCDVIQS